MSLKKSSKYIQHQSAEQFKARGLTGSIYPFTSFSSIISTTTPHAERSSLYDGAKECLQQIYLRRSYQTAATHPEVRKIRTFHPTAPFRTPTLYSRTMPLFVDQGGLRFFVPFQSILDRVGEHRKGWSGLHQGNVLALNTYQTRRSQHSHGS